MYDPTVWVSGMFVTRERLNNLEQGVVGADITNPESAAAAALSDSIDAVSAEISRSSVVVPAFAGDATSHVQGFIDLVPENGVLVLEKGAEYRIDGRSEEHTSELQSRGHLVCRLLLEKKK